MTQVNDMQDSSAQITWNRRGRPRTLAQKRAAFEAQARAALISHPLMAVTDLKQVGRRLKSLRHELKTRPEWKPIADSSRRREVPQSIVARQLKDTPSRTYQSWELGQVETTRANYEMIAKFYTEQLGRTVTANWILFGSDEEPYFGEPARHESSPQPQNGQLDRIEAKIDAILNLLEHEPGEGEARPKSFDERLDATRDLTPPGEAVAEALDARRRSRPPAQERRSNRERQRG